MVCRECEWSEMERDGGSKGCTVAACRDPLFCVTSSVAVSTSARSCRCCTVAACRDPLVLRNFSRCGKYFCSESQMLYGRGMPRPIGFA